MLRQKVGLARMELKGRNMKILVCDDNYETVQKISDLIREHW